MKKFPILGWLFSELTDNPEKQVKDWHDLGITLIVSPHYTAERKSDVIKMLDCAEKLDVMVILSDYRSQWHVMNNLGDEEYTRLAKEAIADYGWHPAVFGFHIGDEPNASDAANAFKAVKIYNGLAPHLTSYLNLLPWFDWIGERLGSPEYAPYLDRAVNEANNKLLSYDCYTQMWEGESGYKDYFNNLREYYLATKRNNVPYVNTVLSCGHYNYRCPSKDDLRWQLSTSVAHGAGGVNWFLIGEQGINDNYRNAPLNNYGERSETFAWLSEVNRYFNDYCGQIINKLRIDNCYHVGKAFGGMPLFEPFANIVSIKSNKIDIPLIVSDFHDDNGVKYYIVCNNSPSESTYVSMSLKGNVKIKKCVWGNKFEPITTHTDPVGEKEVAPDQSLGLWLSPGQLALLKEDL